VLRAGRDGIEETALHDDGPHTSIVHKFPLLDEAGKVYAIGGIATDITERKRTQEALRQGEERFRFLVEGVARLRYLSRWSGKEGWGGKKGGGKKGWALRWGKNHTGGERIKKG